MKILSEKEAWRLIARTFVEEVKIGGDGQMKPSYISPDDRIGICWRIVELHGVRLIKSKTVINMIDVIDNHRGHRTFLSNYKDNEARGLFCLLLAEMV